MNSRRAVAVVGSIVLAFSNDVLPKASASLESSPYHPHTSLRQGQMNTGTRNLMAADLACLGGMGSELGTYYFCLQHPNNQNCIDSPILFEDVEICVDVFTNNLYESLTEQTVVDLSNDCDYVNTAVFNHVSSGCLDASELGCLCDNDKVTIVHTQGAVTQATKPATTTTTTTAIPQLSTTVELLAKDYKTCNGCTPSDITHGKPDPILDFDFGADNRAEFEITGVSTTGDHKLQLEYAAGSTPRELKVDVDGTDFGVVSFASTNGWNDWQMESIMIELVAGEPNILSLTSTAQNAPNLYKLMISEE